ncbi:olfactory receptor 2AJ1 [Dipodomys merriami]|uniref:olfactory receptor 2AJ1 n=1 Tax=Dipodomys merriami TaxID=94247 RepID=UPI003855C928
MGQENYTFSSDFILLGLFSSSQASLVFFSCLFVIFITSITENALMILLIRGDSRLQTPMYFLLSHLSFMDILHISNIVPKMITDFLSGSRTISFVGCGFQIFLSLTLLGGECLLLAAMSYDRYAAICHPLRYPVLMKDAVSRLMAAGAWLVGTLNSTVHTAYALHFPFCHSRAIDHFFCEVPAMLKLSCVDTSHYERGVYVSGIIFLLLPFSMISVSYVQILHTVFQMKSSEAQKKSLSTCSFHMVVVIMYYGPFIFTYMRPKSYHTPGQDKFLAVFYTILTPMLNPIIYSFRNKDVIAAARNMVQSKFLNKK